MDCLQTGRFIAQLRQEAGLTQKELAARLGVTGSAVSKKASQARFVRNQSSSASSTSGRMLSASRPG